MKKLAMLAVAFLAVSAASAETYKLDPAHTEISFRIRHIVTKVRGRFTKFDGRFDYVPGKPESWKAQATIDPASINTDNERRDKHLKSPDFFDVEKCPKMEFVSGKVHDVQGETAKVDGMLTMRCQAHPVTLDVEMTEPMGAEIGAEAKTKVNRKDWGIVWNRTLDKGGTMLGDDVEITISVAGQAAGKGKSGK